MNALTRDLEGLTKSAEACADGKTVSARSCI